jgi:hypothetical protein
MDEELRELLALWLGDQDPGDARRAALLARLRGDEAFRSAFVAEIRLHGMLRAVQAPEPRWLRLEDQFGWSAEGPEVVEALAAQVMREWDRRRKRRRRRWAVAAAVVGLVAAAAYLVFHSTPVAAPRPPSRVAEPSAIATVLHLDGVQCETPRRTLHEGDLMLPGRLYLRTGRLTLAFFSGVSLTVEGPADLELQSADRVFFHHGKLRARVLRGAEGFTVATTGYEVVDLGTEFAMNLQPGGKARVMVFQGEAAVSVIGQDGRSVRSALLERQRSVEVDPNGAGIREVPAQPEAFVPLGEFVPAPLEFAPGYRTTVLASRPWGYWRFESLADGRVPNEVAGRPALKVHGGVALEGPLGGNRWARFRPDDAAQALLLDGTWTPPRAGGYAIELWVQADLPSHNADGQTALVGLVARDERLVSNHVAYLEFASRGRRVPQEPCTVRFLDRWPAGQTGGSDVFSRRTVVPCFWHHIVGQKAGQTLELYVDGEPVGTSPASPDADGPDGPATTACSLIVGRLKRWSLPSRISEVRPFEGRLDELAIYDHPLTPREIRRHAAYTTAGGEPLHPPPPSSR